MSYSVDESKHRMEADKYRVEEYKQLVAEVLEQHKGIPPCDSEVWVELLKGMSKTSVVIHDITKNSTTIILKIDKMLKAKGVSTKYEIQAQEAPATILILADEILKDYETSTNKTSLHKQASKLISRLIAIRIIAEEPAEIEKALKASFGKHKSSKTIAPTHAWLSNDPTQTAQKAENSIKQGGELVDSIHCGHAYLKEIGHFLRIEVAAKCGFDSFDLGIAGKAKKMNADSADGRWWVGYSAKSTSSVVECEVNIKNSMTVESLEDGLDSYETWMGMAGVHSGEEEVEKVKDALGLRIFYEFLKSRESGVAEHAMVATRLRITN